MINRLDAAAPDFETRLRELRTAPVAPPSVRRRVAGILRRVRRDGDAAVVEQIAELDGWRASSPAALEVPQRRLLTAAAGVDVGLRDALHAVAARLRDYHTRQKTHGWTATDAHGNVVGELVHPLRRAMVYAPGGKAAYPSSVLMGVVPAKIAGVEEVVLSTPAPGGELSPLTLAAAAIGGADRVFMLGGAVALAAFAYGTETMPAADVIVGPGNSYVAEAKRQLAGVTGFDSYAGPSEVLIISDGSAPADWLAADMAAQAEHDEDAQSIAVSADAAHLQAVEDALAARLPSMPRAEIVRASLSRRGALILARDGEECIRIAEQIAPEHLQIMTKDADAVASRIRNAGGVFVGEHSCVPLGDYAAGPNHVLPTGGAARFSSPLGVGNFIKRSGLLRASVGGASKLAKLTEILAKAEGLPAHAESARLRIRRDGKSGD